jgi:hypothetical protein
VSSSEEDRGDGTETLSRNHPIFELLRMKKAADARSAASRSSSIEVDPVALKVVSEDDGRAVVALSPRGQKKPVLEEVRPLRRATSSSHDQTEGLFGSPLIHQPWMALRLSRSLLRLRSEQGPPMRNRKRSSTIISMATSNALC